MYLRDLKKEYDVYKGRFTERDSHVVSSVKKLANAGDKIYDTNNINNKVNTLIDLGVFSEYIIDCIQRSYQSYN